MSIFKGDHGGTRPDSEKSAPQNTSVGSGCGVTASRIEIETSAPSNPHTLDRNPPNPLK